MIKAIGMIELKSIAKGIETADFMLKASQVEVIYCKTVCPGKYIILICGDIGSVKESMDKGINISKDKIIDKLILPSVHKEVINVIKGKCTPISLNSIGVMELSNIASGIIAADISCKSGNVELLKLSLGMGIGGKSYFIISGDVSSVKIALDTASEKIDKKKLIDKIVIPWPDRELIKNIL